MPMGRKPQMPKAAATIGASIFALAALLAALVTPASAQTFDVAGYCKGVAEEAGGSYIVERSCREYEQEAKGWLDTESIEDRIRNYCGKVSETVGGSYTIMKACVEQEREARDMMLN